MSAHAPYTSRRQPEAPLQDHFYKVELAKRLNSCQLSYMFRGFPLPYSFSTHPLSIYNASLEPYDIPEELPIQNYPSGKAVIRFNGHMPRNEYLTWQISLYGPNYMPLRNLRNKVARVQVNVAVSKSFFWQALVQDSSTILRALAISLEIGKDLYIEYLDPNRVLYQTVDSLGRKTYLVAKRS
ncbi:hypothetical protein H2248_003892 [Termitomyces sp. 'cryptogamus']|nr:hypothetical protein H2248_003892 [Termitomyces sp. 'cryptogamus']